MLIDGAWICNQIGLYDYMKRIIKYLIILLSGFMLTACTRNMPVETITISDDVSSDEYTIDSEVQDTEEIVEPNEDIESIKEEKEAVEVPSDGLDLSIKRNRIDSDIMEECQIADNYPAHFVFDSDGNLKSVSTTGRDGSEIKWYEFEYDNNGRVKTIYTYLENQVHDIDTYERNDDGQKRVVYHQTPDFNGGFKLTTYHVTEYDSNGRRISDKRYDADGNQLTEFGYEAYVYDDMGRRIKHKRLSAESNELLSEATYEYDSEGKLTYVYRKSEYTEYFYDQGNFQYSIWYSEEYPDGMKIYDYVIPSDLWEMMDYQLKDCNRSLK